MRRAQGLNERAVEHFVELVPSRVDSRHAVDFSKRSVPPDDSAVQVFDDETVVERFNNVLVEFLQTLQLARFHLKLAVQPAVLERRGDVAADRRQQTHVFAAQGLSLAALAERQHGDSPALRHAWDEIVNAAYAPERELLGRKRAVEPRIVERQRDSTGQARGELRMAPQAGHREVAKSLDSNHLVVARPLIDEKQRHAVDDERLANARHEPFAETIEIEVAVRVAREAHEGAAVVYLSR